ncbi:hypothetical protein IL38_23965 [Actinopolyspora erythraea]|uniref:Uncharacterized protein n=1 Tax=Actinopolyspora erythraea TaxID=414996 RepID=A0ABR4WYA4_9ACTN|nr:hypothetical protein [Actinopolyspora erythraea]KGI79358.1 hypothetical protein IL38_23965 [Actinopolyspora erythraea]
MTMPATHHPHTTDPLTTPLTLWTRRKHPDQPARYRLATPCCGNGTLATEHQLHAHSTTGITLTCGRSLWGGKQHPPRGCGTTWRVYLVGTTQLQWHRTL